MGPAGLRRDCKINDLRETETPENPDVSLCLSQSIVSANRIFRPPELRSPAKAATMARADRDIEAVSTYTLHDETVARQASHIARSYLIGFELAAAISVLAFGFAR